MATHAKKAAQASSRPAQAGQHPADIDVFVLSEGGVIITPDFPEPRTRSEVFEGADPGNIHSPDHLIGLIEECVPLMHHFQHLSWDYLDHLTSAETFSQRLLENTHMGAQARIVRALRADPEDGWRSWISLSGDAGLGHFITHVYRWLQSPIDWGESAHFDTICTGQQAAFAYFEPLPPAFLKALGVGLIEGDVPGSSSRAAVLRKSVAQANAAAALLELGMRFQGRSIGPAEARGDEGEHEGAVHG